MRRVFLVSVAFAAACSSEPNPEGNPLWWPAIGIANAAEVAASNRRRGQVELLVKTNHPRIVDEIRAGGGPVLTEAMDIARIPQADRAARIIQMQADSALYVVNPGALVGALMVYGG